MCGGIGMKIRDAIKLAEADGWRMVVQEGSHRQRQAIKKGRVTIAGHLAKDLDPKTKSSILRQSGLK
jgi:predicted RNA binding protein YcfA (HicA-like mRNA interferase family)